MKTLLINAHPDYDSDKTHSSKLCSYFYQKYKNISPESDIQILNLYAEELPTIDKVFLKLISKLTKKEELDREEQLVYQRQSHYLEQFMECMRIVIIMPVHNFNVPVKLKDYIDNILIPNETFRYTRNGSVGLMTDGRKALLLQSSGSIYTNNDRYSPAEFGYKYLESMFVEFMGFDSFHIVRAQGTDLKDADQDMIMRRAYDDIDREIAGFA